MMGNDGMEFKLIQTLCDDYLSNQSKKKFIFCSIKESRTSSYFTRNFG